jgi:hypothetical protein
LPSAFVSWIETVFSKMRSVSALPPAAWPEEGSIMATQMPAASAAAMTAGESRRVMWCIGLPPLAERAGGDDRRREREGVGVDHPLQA